MLKFILLPFCFWLTLSSAFAFGNDADVCVSDYASVYPPSPAATGDRALIPEGPTLALAKREIFKDNLNRGKNLGFYAIPFAGSEYYPAIPSHYTKSASVEAFPYFGRKLPMTAREIAAMMDWCIQRGRINFDIAGLNIAEARAILDKTKQLINQRTLSNFTTDPGKKLLIEMKIADLEEDLLKIGSGRYTEWELARLAFAHSDLNSTNVKFYDRGEEITREAKAKLISILLGK